MALTSTSQNLISIAITTVCLATTHLEIVLIGFTLIMINTQEIQLFGFTKWIIMLRNTIIAQLSQGMEFTTSLLSQNNVFSSGKLR